MNDEVEITLLQDEVEISEPLVADYILPTASATTLGGVKIGDNLSISSNGVLSVPKATSSSLGVVQAGEGISIDSNGVISANGDGYVLPEATKNTLGGVYVDDTLSTSSAHPVQNSVVSLSIASLQNYLNTLDGNVDDLDLAVGNLSTTVGNFSTTINNMSDDISDNTTNIQTNADDISSLTGRMVDAESDLTTLDGYATTLMTQTYESYNYDDIDDNVWTLGKIELIGYGMNGYINIDLEGSLTISSGSSNTIFTLPTILPEYTVTGIAITDDAPLMIKVTDSGEVKLYNISSSSITLTQLNANLAIQIGSDNP